MESTTAPEGELIHWSVESLTPSLSVSGSYGELPKLISSSLVNPSLSQSAAFHSAEAVPAVSG